MKKKTKIAEKEIEGIKELLLSRDRTNQKVAVEILRGKGISIGRFIRIMWPDLTIELVRAQPNNFYRINLGHIRITTYRNKGQRVVNPKTGRGNNPIVIKCYYEGDGRMHFYSYRPYISDILGLLRIMPEILEIGDRLRSDYYKKKRK